MMAWGEAGAGTIEGEGAAAGPPAAAAAKLNGCVGLTVGCGEMALARRASAVQKSVGFSACGSGLAGATASSPRAVRLAPWSRLGWRRGGALVARTLAGVRAKVPRGSPGLSGIVGGAVSGRLPPLSAAGHGCSARGGPGAVLGPGSGVSVGAGA